MAQDETEFDRLLKETREWEARDRARHPASAMKDEGDGDSFRPASRAPTVTTGELEKKTTADLNLKPPPKAQAAQPQATRVRKKGGWGWIWVLILLYFLFRHFVR
ncbi:MAG TPA: hypothetical protein VN782_07650 [Usitatibacter sp.]|nr:hypothetical protein [Usitatibacter sp.]